MWWRKVFVTGFMAIFVLANIGLAVDNTTREESDSIGEELEHACSPWTNLNATAFQRNWETLSRNIESNLSVSSRPKEFSENVEALLEQLGNNAPERDYYDVGSTVAGTGSVYALAQCWQFLDNTTYGNLGGRQTIEQVFSDYEVVRNATDNFDGRNLVGKGGFGEVYKGRLVDGRTIAVKKLNGRQSTQAMDEFVKEVELISSLRHRNLVRLLGCCTHGHERLLVYEFMSNNSLDKHLFGDAKNQLQWDVRFSIVLGTARGLAYLHDDSNVRIRHRDIKAANILLDDKFQPRIADFDLAKFFPEDDMDTEEWVASTSGQQDDDCDDAFVNLSALIPVNDETHITEEENPLLGWKLPKLPYNEVYQKSKSFHLIASTAIRSRESCIRVKTSAKSEYDIPLISPKDLAYLKKQSVHKFVHIGCVQIGITPLV
ncbi:hypothetical protein KI387_039503 [Taxus chinensis]|uniref:Protein kinase domain-containing protein n=1 Tax=Taxus chinensis TaxID=29808 RepID=A0AA38FBL2_TAXCH|nr:hypothetical protein KI387_039503 [Taxus chinensis]